jgi:hypothetical protein
VKHAARNMMRDFYPQALSLIKTMFWAEFPNSAMISG